MKIYLYITYTGKKVISRVTFAREKLSFIHKLKGTN